MAKNPKTETSKPKVVGQAPHLEAFSIAEFCARHCISRAHFYNLRNAGEGPREMALGTRVLISAEAAAEWRRQREVAVHTPNDGSTGSGADAALASGKQ